MNSICTSPHCRSYADSVGAYRAANLTHAAVKTQAAADLSFTTTDGDIVTLSSRSQQRAEYSTYDFQGRLQGQTVAAQGEKLAIESRNALAISVRGELDDEELADIQKVLDAVEAAGGDLAAGNLDGALAPFAGLGEIDSLQSFQATLSLSREISAFQATSRTAQGNLPVGKSSQEERNVPAAQSQFQRLLEAIEQLDKHGKDHLSKHLKQRLEKLTEPRSPADRDRQLAEQISSELLKRHNLSDG